MVYSQYTIFFLFLLTLLPAQAQDRPAQAQDRPAQVQDRPAQVQDRENAGEELYLSVGYTDSNKYRIESENTQNIYLDGILERSDIQIQNNILLNIIRRGSDGLTVAGKTELLEQGQLLSESEYQYKINKQGFMSSRNLEAIPFIIDVPTFPNETVKPGDSWINSSTEILELPRLGTELRVPVQIEYTFWGYDTLPELGVDPSVQYSVLLIDYAINNYRYRHIGKNRRSTNVLLNASFSIFMWWNHEKLRPEYYLEQYEIDFNYDGDEEIRFEGEIESRVYPVLEDITDKLEEDLRESFTEEETSPTLNRNEKGLTLTFSQINFHPDSTRPLRPLGEQLDPLINVLKDMNPRRMLIEGHTAKIGTEDMQQRLSVERAKVIRDYLKNKLSWEPRYFLFRGHGSEKPFASNSTEEGRKKNRRVEITILEN